MTAEDMVLLHQLSPQDGDRLADQDDASSLDADLDDTAPARDLVAAQRGAIELLRPVRAETAVRRATDGIFVDTDPRREEPRNEVMAARTGTAGHDHPSNRKLLQPADIRVQAANLFLGLDVDQEIEPIATGITNRGLNRRTQLGELARLFHFLVDGLGRKIELDPSRAPLGGQQAAPGLEPGGLTAQEGVLLPRGREPWPGWRDRKDRPLSWE